jgi:hypothetical protein
MDKAQVVLYEYVEHKETKQVAFRILEGKYAAVIFTFEGVEIKHIENPEETESIPVKFTWNILTKPEDTVIIKDEFGPIISPILMETIEKKLADGTLEYNDSETGIDNIKQLDS